MEDAACNLKNNLRALQKRIELACERVGRDKDSVRLMLVSKTVDIARIKQAVSLGFHLFGENKVQELSSKSHQLQDSQVEFHFIGHLQKNKIKKCLDSAQVIQSVDHFTLALEMQRQLELADSIKQIYIQVNTSQEISKFGVAPDCTVELIRQISKLDRLQIRGLMTLALFSQDESRVRPCFKILKLLQTQVMDMGIPNVDLQELSMGMSGDYEVAIEEGATIVRLGTAVFGERLRPDSYYWPEKS